MYTTDPQITPNNSNKTKTRDVQLGDGSLKEERAVRCVLVGIFEGHRLIEFNFYHGRREPFLGEGTEAHHANLEHVLWGE